MRRRSLRSQKGEAKSWPMGKAVRPATSTFLRMDGLLGLPQLPVLAGQFPFRKAAGQAECPAARAVEPALFPAEPAKDLTHRQDPTRMPDGRPPGLHAQLSVERGIAFHFR